MNIAIILAGGNKRVEEHGVPVQFISLFEKPILVYTLEGIQKHPQIDAILVVCKPGWENAVSAYAKQFGISKLQWTTRGGDTVQESIRNGVNYLKELASEEDVIIIHDGNRPFINGDVLTDVIRVTQLPPQVIRSRCSMWMNRMNPRHKAISTETRYAVLPLPKDTDIRI